MPARRARLRGKIGVQVHEHRARQVPGTIGLDARRATEPPADVEQHRRGGPGQRPRERAHIGQRAGLTV